LRTLGENDAGVPARSPSVSKGDIDAPNQPKKSRDEAGSRFDTCDLMSRLWSIIDIEAAGHDHRSAATPPAFLHSHPACAAGDVLRQKAAVLRYAPRVIRIARAQKPTPFPGIARDVLAHLRLPPAFRQSPQSYPRRLGCRLSEPPRSGRGHSSARRSAPGAPLSASRLLR
jgi:hypothetical protein